ncbi:SusD/RagB family nutrient-binding outer membrane lipoprotein [Flammeovirga kamogawensis]|uniref:SusD/RagB family nutrient-binding outer membrane lipoprotein n=1 Tax=Flammeovirga kamogawensis TaxID=373891 RepID=A0ABX8GSD9_9BACT|nr:SusD/RagB family nutrient-binding outer membrane lipoprotein [Flammeovirga kamogawensis]MBB6461434.1 hypothetical protein [Flammeovirga kamogawensis]QWG06329.1 SusD/RagB family nutrient-binding outer membrane lipoprotein [Flammeovirga kamogawensis]TRX68157.1 SusD/RagB family nutrient-binding outer membrane lipoprotein [Flammeovirga kamogawensis]
MKNLLKRYILLGAASLSLFSCTSNFEQMNVDPNKITDEQLEADGQIIAAYFPQLSRSIYYNFDNSNWKWQVQQNLNGDVFSGYMAPPTPFAGNANATHYNLIWNDWPASIAYENIMGPAYEIAKREEDADPRLYAVSLVLKVLGMHRVTDVYGPSPYLGYGSENVSYNSQEEIYTRFFEELSKAIEILGAEGADEPYGGFSGVDDIFQGDFAMWKKLAASLKLRLALRISNVDPTNAKIHAESAISAGVFEAGDNALVTSPIIHPLATIAHSWGDIKMGATMESFLVGYNDPRLAVYFTPVNSELSGIPADTFKGIRSGVDLPDKSGSPYTGYSSINDKFISQTSPITLMTGAEVYFLRAEAALNGWTAGGTTQELYEGGIRESFAFLGAGGVDSYISDMSSVPANYSDPNWALAGADSYDIDATTDVKVAFDQSRAMEQIITQKWIAMFPEGMEAWSELRRTGYPKVFPVKYNKSGGLIDTTKGIRRLGFPSYEAGSNPEGYAKAVELLKKEGQGGEDNGGTPVWWDTKSI